jgi:7-keto-8-aminopelargonate synthetase-like enzyme
MSRGDERWARVYAGTRRILDHLAGLGVATRNTSAFPIVEVPLADAGDLDLAGRFLFDRGIYATLAFYPGVPRDEVGFRLQVTAANTAEELDRLLVVLDELAAAIPLRSAATHPFPPPPEIDLR